MKPCQRVILLHDLCSVGKAALTNMMPILGIMGIETCPVPTMLLSTHTGGYGQPAIHAVPTDYITACADHYQREGVIPDGIFIGYLGNAAAVAAVKYFVSCFPQVPVIFDPIMGDHGKYYRNFDHNYGQAIRELLPLAQVILPNLTECCLLLGREYKDRFEAAELKIIGQELQALGASDIIITSVSGAGGQKGIASFEKGHFELVHHPYFPGEYHGTGDAFDGVFVGEYLKGTPLPQAIKRAHDFVFACMSESARYEYDKREGLLIEKNLSMLV